MYWYSNKEFYIKWSNQLSSPFTVWKGVRQGSVLSPTLFNVFMDDLSSQLSSSFSGCYFNGHNFNHLFYADDTVLLSPSPHGLQELLDICQRYAVSCGIKYNVKKTKCMCIKPTSKNILVPDVFINGNVLKWVNEQEYLDVNLRNDQRDDTDINRHIRSTYVRGNILFNTI